MGGGIGKFSTQVKNNDGLISAQALFCVFFRHRFDSLIPALQALDLCASHGTFCVCMCVWCSPGDTCNHDHISTYNFKAE